MRHDFVLNVMGWIFHTVNVNHQAPDIPKYEQDHPHVVSRLYGQPKIDTFKYRFSILSKERCVAFVILPRICCRNNYLFRPSWLPETEIPTMWLPSLAKPYGQRKWLFWEIYWESQLIHCRRHDVLPTTVSKKIYF